MRGDEPKRWNVETAILIGDLWAFAGVMIGMAVPFALIAVLFLTGTYRAVAGLLGLWLFAIVAVLMLICSWLIWSCLITPWRLWAYRRVDDVAALKAAATGTLIWPEGHFLGRTEFRSRAQALELARLEEASATRCKELRAAGQMPPEPRTVVGTLLKALFFGGIVGFICVFLPVGVVDLLGLPITPILAPLLAALVAFGLAVFLSTKALGERISANEAFRRILPAWGLRKDDDIRPS